MGDLGSLTLVGILGTLAVLVRHEIVFAIMAGVFVMETLSVIIQVGSYKLRGKRVFLMAPIHHHFESVSYTHLRAHETKANLVCRLLLEKKKQKKKKKKIKLLFQSPTIS